MADNAEKMEVEQSDSVGDDLREVIDKLEAETDLSESDGIEEEKQEAAPQEAAEEVSEEEKAEFVPEPVKLKAPLDWGPQLKQEFGKLPQDVQKAIHDRELHVNQMMQQTAQERKQAQAFNQVVSEFSGLMAAEGVADPMQGIRGLLMTTAQLAMGTPQIKAQKIAQLINHYTVDIELLDSILVGEAPQPQQPPADPRVDYIFNRIQQAEQQQRQTITQTAETDVEQFGAKPENEFFEDVRGAMADFLEVAAQHGQPMSLEEAYDRACAMNPEIAAIRAQRMAQGQTDQASHRAQQKANAAASISGKAAGGASAQPMEGGSIREILEAQFSDTGRI